MLRVHKVRIAEFPGQVSLELWVENIVTGLFLLDNTPGFHGNERMLKFGESLEITAVDMGRFLYHVYDFFIMPS